MAWDSSRPVPWQRLMREWVVYALIMVAILLLLFRDSSVVGALAGVLVSGPLYLALGAVLAKFGYQRKTLRDLRAEREARGAERDAGAEVGDGTSSAASAGPRSRPAPTKRTSGGSNRPRAKRRRR